MNEIEIYDTYNDCPENDAFESFEANNVSHETIANILGYDVANDYIDWIRKNIK